MSLERKKENSNLDFLQPFAEEIRWLKKKINKNANKEKYKNSTPFWMRNEHYEDFYKNITLDSRANTFLEQITNKKDVQNIIHNAVRIQQTFWNDVIDNTQALQRAQMGNSSDVWMETFLGVDLDSYNLIKLFFSTIDDWGNPFDRIEKPSDMIFVNENVLENLRENEGFLYLSDLPSDLQDIILGWIERKYEDKLDNLIFTLSQTEWTTPSSLFYNEEVFQLFVKYYNTQQLKEGKPIITGWSLSYEKKQELKRYFNAKLYELWFEIDEDDVDESILKDIQERDRRIREENHRRMVQWKERNNKINGSFQRRIIPPENKDSTQKTIDNIQYASGVNIAKNAWLWRQLSEEYSRNDNIEDSQINERAFWIARSKFIGTHGDLKSYVTMGTMLNLYDKNSNTIKNLEDRARDWLRETFKNNPTEVSKIYDRLLSFPNEIDETKDSLLKNVNSAKAVENENRNNYAIGDVLDNVRASFSMIKTNGNVDTQDWNSNLFIFDKETPVKKIWNDIIISGSFEGSNVKVRYDLKSGKLFMNSFIHKLGTDKIKIWDNTLIDLEIGQISPFDAVLNNYYRSPTEPSKEQTNHTWHSNTIHWKDFLSHETENVGIAIRPKPEWFHPKRDSKNGTDSREEGSGYALLGSQINIISNAMRENMKIQGYKNSAIVNFFKTFWFGIMSDSWDFSNLDFEKGSNIFDVIQIIDNTGDQENHDIESLKYFNNTFMPTISEYSWLKWGEKNITQDKNSKKAKILFEYDGNNGNINFLKNISRDFNPQQFSWIANFDSSYQLWFANLIKLRISLWSEPNWKLDIMKMRNFIEDLENLEHKNEKPIQLS